VVPDRPGALAAIGDTPIARLSRVVDAGMAEGVWSGPSTGANIAAALAIARRLGEGARVATIQVDSGLKYLAGELYT
jgi:cysteine synthase